MIDLTTKPCPVCRQMTSTLLYQTTYPEHHYNKKFIMRRCEGCGLLFNSPRLSDEDLGHLYGRNYYFFLRKDAREFNRIVAMHQRTVGMLDQSRVPVKRTIDIGCGRGYFPAVLTRLGWDASGIELSPEAAEYGRSKFHLKVFTGTVEQYAASGTAEKFPLVTAIDVIEHVPSPSEFIRATASLVEPGGRIIIDTPNGAAANIKTQGVLWKGFNPFHIYLFSVENLEQILSQHGFVVEQRFSYGNAPLAKGLRENAIAGFKQLGLIAPLASLYFALKKLIPSTKGADDALAQAATRLEREPGYDKHPDSSGPLAKTFRGDNIVVIARKHS